MGRPSGFGRAANKRVARVLSVRFDERTLGRIEGLSSELKQPVSTTIRSLVLAALGDDAAVAVAAESAFLLDGVRRRLLLKIAGELRPRVEAIVDEVMAELGVHPDDIPDGIEEPEDEDAHR